ncbi:T9SS type A sorting domain-containing protein [Rudanella paleaurantiibacter]|uniref:T9SS type A sorting domain-containing protein n=1 Tax=Rudanella paleaurantiibacter TaxID=2614655 RepID=A0A7J5U5L8_9BACT|nr:T9SS type A sorting domain-containing protein [Rudanella paleaurantiibacter]
MVEGAEYGLHSRDGALVSAHGRIPDGLTIDIHKPIQERIALEAALSTLGLSRESLRGSDKLPKGELILTSLSDQMVASNFRLAYIFTINLNRVYVDALTGKTIGNYSVVNFDNFGKSDFTSVVSPTSQRASKSTPVNAVFLPGTFVHLNSRYPSGQRQQTFETESNGQAGFRLTMSTPVPNVIGSLDTRIDQNGNGVIFGVTGRPADLRWGDDDLVVNTSNTWGTNSQDATVAHWATWRAYEYFRPFGINGLNGNGFVARVLVNTNLPNNAFYVRYPFDNLPYLYFGRSILSNTTRSMASLDIVGHEYGHGVSQLLVGGNGLNGDGSLFAEARALNEGFSDIFGTALERHLMPNEWNWTIGEDTGQNNQIRNLANPAASGTPQASTYQGNNWDSDPNTSGHRNSTVLSHWFYLMNNWGAGSVGFDDAMKIVIHALDFYMIESSNFLDARNATLAAAQDLFGNCSPQERTVVETWQHVGRGFPFNYQCNRLCDYQPTFTGPATATPGQIVTLQAQCSPNQFEACNDVRYSFNQQPFGSTNTTQIQIPTGSGNVTYTVRMDKPAWNCYVKSATHTILITGSDPCAITTPRRVGSWNGLEVQIRAFPNGKRALVTAIVGSPTDKYYPRGDNFWDSFTKDPGVSNLQACLNAGQTGWWGLGFPGGLIPPSGYVQGTEQDGAIFFQQGGSNPCNFSVQRVGTWNGLDVEIRQYPGQKWALATKIVGSPTDKHYPRGDNFWDNFTKDAGADTWRGCLNAGQTGWWGLGFPSGITPQPGYTQGTEADGAIFFQTGGARIARELTADDVALVRVRPNPVQDEVTINFSLSKAQTVTLRIVDLQGRTLQQHTHAGIGGTNEKTLNVSSLPAGLYGLEVLLDQQRVVHKLLKQ